MDNLFLYILSVTITAGFLLLLRRILRNRIPPRCTVCLWAVLAVRILLPVLPSSPASVMNLLEPRDRPGAVSEAPIPQAEPAASPPPVTNTPVSDQLVPRKEDTNRNLRAVLLFLWAGGSVLTASYFLLGYIRFCLKAKKEPLLDGRASAQLARAKERLGVKAPVKLRLSVEGPLLLGVIKPQILLPKALLEAEDSELSLIFLHELCHQKHKDNALSFFAAAVLCLFWFNPFIWACFPAFRRDLELACDERTASFADSPKAYAALLLKAAMPKHPANRLAASMGGGKKELFSRIHFLADYKKPRLWVSIAAVLLVSGLVLICLTNSPSFSKSKARRAMDELEASIRTDSGKICFTLPQDYPAASEWNILISGRQEVENMGMSLHYFEKQNEEKSWEAGKTYRTRIDYNAMTDFNLLFSLPDEPEREIDLLKRFRTNDGRGSIPERFGSGFIPGTEMEVVMRMVSGRVVTQDSPDCVPGGGPDGMAFPTNYIGRFELSVEKNNEVLSTLSLWFPDDGLIYCYPGIPENFPIQFGNYAGEGATSFAIGEGGYVGANRPYMLFNVTADGNLQRLFAVTNTSGIGGEEGASHLFEVDDGVLKSNYYDQETGQTMPMLVGQLY